MKSIAVTFFCLTFLLPNISMGQAGSLDPSFGSGIIKLDYKTFSTGLATRDDYANAVIVTPDDKILVAGFSFQDGMYHQFALTRYNLNGTQDNTFGNSGLVATSFLSNREGYGHTMALQADGKIIVGGYSQVNGGSGGIFQLVRYSPNGVIDNTFGNKGKDSTSITGYDKMNSLVIQPDGKILAAGYGSSSCELVRYQTNGALDNNFGTNGILKTNFGGNVGQLKGMVLQTDGKIIVVGYSSDTKHSLMTLMRLKTDGTIDNTFGTNGVAGTFIDSTRNEANSVVLQSDGKIVVSGFTQKTGFLSYLLVARYLSNGTLDPTFGTGGYTKVKVGYRDQHATKVALQADGKILVATNSIMDTVSSNYLYGTALVRFNSDGTIDKSFGTNGIARVKIYAGKDYVNEYVKSMALQKDSKILLAVTTLDNLNYADNPYLVRFLPGQVIVTGMENTAEDASASVYPNPSSDVVTVTFNNLLNEYPGYTVTNLLGEEVLKSDKDSENQGALTNALNINVTSLPNGIYLLHLSENSNAAPVKFMVSH